MDEPTRRAWSKPELIVLVRSGPEEAVLGACKNELKPSVSQYTNFGGCAIVMPMICSRCSAPDGS